MENKNWYAAFVETGCEEKVKERLKYKLKDKFSFYTPKRELSERRQGKTYETTKLLFPGYILIYGNIEMEDIESFKNIPNLRHILNSSGEPQIIKKEEIALINKLMENGETIGPSSLIVEGTKVKVIEGSLKGMEGLIQKIDKRKKRAKVKMSFLGENRTIDFAINLITNL